MPKRKSPRTPDSLGGRPPNTLLVITSKVGAMGFVTYFINVEGVPHFIETPLAYALVRGGYARFLTTEQAHDELFG